MSDLADIEGILSDLSGTIGVLRHMATSNFEVKELELTAAGCREAGYKVPEKVPMVETLLSEAEGGA